LKRSVAKVGDPVLDGVSMLSAPEKLFLKVLRKMAKEQEPFTYRRAAALAGWKSVQMAWQTRASLEAKGLLTIGKRLALIECPVEVSEATA